MKWILDMILPIIKDCNSPQEAELVIIEWGKFQEPRDDDMSLIMVRLMNSDYENLNKNG